MDTVVVLNIPLKAVSTYTLVDPDSIAGRFYASPTSGLYAEVDASAPASVDVEVATGLRSWGSALRKLIDAVFLVASGAGKIWCTITTRADEFTYTSELLKDGATKVSVGRGIWDNYLGYRIRVAVKQKLVIDQIELLMGTSRRRRT